MSSSKKFILKIIIAVLAVGLAAFLALIGNYFYKIKTGQILSAQFTKAGASATKVIKLNYEEIINSKAPYFGAAAPELTVVVFGNFYCTHSQEASATVRELMLAYQSTVKFIYRDYPMDDVYPNSSYLAMAGKCADEQKKFWAFYDKIYKNPNSDLDDLATQIGLDGTKFSACLEQNKYYADLKGDLTDGFNNGVKGTPTFFFIKKGYESTPLKVEGAIDKDVFEKIIDGLLK